MPNWYYPDEKECVDCGEILCICMENYNDPVEDDWRTTDDWPVGPNPDEIWEQIRREEEAEKAKEIEKGKHRAARPLSVMALCEGNGRSYTRGWRGAKWVKRLTNKAMRRLAKQDPENAPTKPHYTGWVW